MRPKLAKALNWTGAAALVAAPFLIDAGIGKALAIIGLALITRQALEVKAYNLAIANGLGIAGYLISWLNQ
jgi:hypothetical protein